MYDNSIKEGNIQCIFVAEGEQHSNSVYLVWGNAVVTMSAETINTLRPSIPRLSIAI
jgi:hypothetical protein